MNPTNEPNVRTNETKQSIKDFERLADMLFPEPNAKWPGYIG